MTAEQVDAYGRQRTKTRRFILHVLIYGSLIFGSGFWLWVHATKYGCGLCEHLEWSDIPIYLVGGGLWGLLLWLAKEQRYAAEIQDAEQGAPSNR